MSVRKFAATLVAVGTLVTLGGCTQGSKGPINQKDFASQYRSRQSVSKTWAACVAEQLFTNKDKALNLTTAERKAFNATKPKEALSNSIEPKAEKAGAACKAKGLRP